VPGTVGWQFPSSGVVVVSTPLIMTAVVSTLLVRFTVVRDIEPSSEAKL
jgi:hypothetical protein